MRGNLPPSPPSTNQLKNRRLGVVTEHIGKLASGDSAFRQKMFKWLFSILNIVYTVCVKVAVIVEQSSVTVADVNSRRNTVPVCVIPPIGAP